MTSIEIDGVTYTVSDETAKKIVKGEESKELHGLFVEKIKEAAGSCKIKISNNTQRPMLEWTVSKHLEDVHIFGTLRVMRGKKGETSVAQQLELLKEQFPDAEDLATVV